MASTGCAIVVEGYTDVIALHEAGVTNVVATLGTGAHHAAHPGARRSTRAQEDRLPVRRRRGGPEGGRPRPGLHRREHLRQEPQLRGASGRHPAEQPGSGRVRASRRRGSPGGGGGRGAAAHRVRPRDERLDSFDLDTAPGRDRALDACLAVLAPIKDTLVAKDYAVRTWSRLRAHGRLGIEEADVLERLAALEVPRSAGEEEAAPEASMSRPARRALSQAERNRLRFEREFLALACQHPLVGLAHADALAQVQWHEEVHRLLAESVLATLSENPGAAPADIVTKATLATPHAARVLTAGSSYPSSTPEAIGAYLAEELALGDAEEAIGALHGPDERRGRRRGGRACCTPPSPPLQMDVGAGRHWSRWRPPPGSAGRPTPKLARADQGRPAEDRPSVDFAGHLDRGALPHHNVPSN